jgi:hypothetical protein
MASENKNTPNRINLIDLYTKHFGYISFPPAKRDNTIRVNKPTKGDDLPIKDFQIEQKSLLGTPLMMPCSVELENGELWQLPNEPLIHITGSKTSILTKFDGQDGAFKELFSLDDYQVTIRGIAINEDNDDYPEEMVRKIRSAFEHKKSSKVVCRLLSLFNINLLYINKIDMPPLEGAQSYQVYEISGLSDRVFDLELKNSSTIL